ncbi:MAG: hypothetical protein ACT4PU_09150 [Planctomycetota bacterium]
MPPLVRVVQTEPHEFADMNWRPARRRSRCASWPRRGPARLVLVILALVALLSAAGPSSVGFLVHAHDLADEHLHGLPVALLGHDRHAFPEWHADQHPQRLPDDESAQSPLQERLIVVVDVPVTWPAGRAGRGVDTLANIELEQHSWLPVTAARVPLETCAPLGLPPPVGRRSSIARLLCANHALRI